MKLSHLSKGVSAGILSLSLAMLPATFSASAQTTVSPTEPGTPTTVVEGDRDDGFDWGWLGLLGLIGLAGLMRKPADTTRYRDPDTVTTGTTGTTGTTRTGYRD
ncbi:WGxxGxxG family protein [Oscillatoria amoena NRMC-F 0135]|nr:WGxxGxxG family protein [Oscillatoria laete-virens]MCD8487363.1 WGxxGxxG-CTERM domain-containing protein [Desertifilum sp.]MDI9640352.1 WGxxGxxG-CTERM domain-containing protein [Geitlerinema splendidum]MDL5044769.1 WGxxGxxG family protein [Oscillatoria amoena NRMC-F 0135]NES95547.1 WGxxGxxG-CTERM domain-containing protein [Desertifilum sp. SIO1I2]MDL5052125.1 WGxxGxxG family protein [Oscillatoria laete-virens NRMC-F 0139]